jgi:class 3 adenylate cyclase
MLKFARVASALLGLLTGAADARAAVSREAGFFFIQSFTPKTYGASPQNWAVAQDHRGVMYFGNTDGLLEYDGVSWRKIKIPNGSGVRSLAVDANGRVYVGAQREFGYLQPDARGDMQYVSLSSAIPESERTFGDVFTAYPTSQGIYFGTNRKLFRWNPRTGIKTWKTDTLFGRLLISDDTPYVLVVKQGLSRIRDDQLELVPGGDRFAAENVRGVYSTGGSLLVVTTDALFRQVGDTFEKVNSGASKALADGQVYTTLLLDSGELALGTTHGGLLLMDSQGDIERTIGKAVGLPSEKVNAIYADRQGALWLALESGIARLDFALSQFDGRTGLQGSTYAIARDSNTLYAGTAVGLFRLNPALQSEAAFEAVPGIRDTVFALLPTASGLLVGALGGLYQVEKPSPSGKSEAKLITKMDGVEDLEISPRDPDILYVAGRSFLSLLRRTGKEWRKEKEVPSGGKDFRTVVEDSDGRVWATTPADIARIDFRADPPTVERFDASRGVPAEGWKNAYMVSGRVIFATQKGLLRFDPVDRRFRPDVSLGAMFADGSHAVSIVRETADGDVWITGEGYHGILERRPGGGFDWNPMPLLGTGIGELYTVWVDRDAVAWAAGMDGWLARFDPAERKTLGALSVLLRRVGSIDASAPLFDGAGAAPVGQRKLHLKYRDDSLRFEFAAPVYDQEGSTEYQVRLDGVDREWSPWTTETRKDYTTLLEGTYTFHVRARTPRGQLSEAASFEFSVAPPWYRTWWAALMYLAAAATLVWVLFRWRLAQLSARNQQLEIIVAERTTEIRHQRDQIQIEEGKTKNLLLNILPALVADELRATGAVAPMVFNEVTVCFTDFVGFTLSSETLPARVLVSTLDKYFTAFDGIVTRYGLEKLKTIGDSYMFVSGLPNPRRSHAVDAVMAALEMLEAVKRAQAMKDSPVTWQVRIGLHTGPVVAGVVGVRKFAFDIWGNTVNLASRMESGGGANRVNVSARTHESIKDFIDCEARGLVMTKDRRALEMFFARELRPELSDPAVFAARYRDAFSVEPRVHPSTEPAEPQETRTLLT